MEQHTEKRGKTLEWLLDQPVAIQFELFRHHRELSKLLINQLLQDEVEQKAGEKYTNKLIGYSIGENHIADEVEVTTSLLYK